MKKKNKSRRHWTLNEHCYSECPIDWAPFFVARVCFVSCLHSHPASIQIVAAEAAADSSSSCRSGNRISPQQHTGSSRSIYLLIDFAIYASMYLSVCMYVRLSVCLLVYLSTYLSICLSICLSINQLSIYLFINLSIVFLIWCLYLPIHWLIDLVICLSTSDLSID